MPLDKSGTPEARSRNIAELRHAGRPLDQAIAIAYSVEDEKRKKERHEHESKKYGQ